MKNRVRTKVVYLFSKTPVFLSELIPKFFGKALYNQVVGMIDQFNEELFWERPIDVDRVPMLFAHVPPGTDALILFPELDRTVRIALQVHFEFGIIQSGKGEHLSGHLKDQGGLIERKLFRYKWLAQTINPEFFYIHLLSSILIF